MKRIIILGVAIATTLLFAISAKAQDLNEAVDLYNKAKQSLQNKQYDQALLTATNAYQMIKGIGNAEGEEVSSLKSSCEKLLVNIPYTQGKELLGQNKYTEAITKLTEAKNAASKYSKQDMANEISATLAQAASNKVSSVFGGAAGSSGMGDSPTNPTAASTVVSAPATPSAESLLSLADSYSKKNDQVNAISSYEKAITAATASNDTKSLATAKSQLANIYMAKAATAQKSKKYADVCTYAQQAAQYQESAKAYTTAGTAALQLKKYDDAISNLEKAAALEKDTKSLQAIQYSLGSAYDKKGDKVKACENYSKVATNPQYKATVAARKKALKC